MYFYINFYINYIISKISITFFVLIYLQVVISEKSVNKQGLVQNLIVEVNQLLYYD